ncbi:MAG: sulfatase [Verrucomicrobiota bacterium]|nr:sulfatase [Verrucomicrobiota bacterium]
MRLLLYSILISFYSLPLVISAERLPNILWIVAEDLSPFFGCYGDSVNIKHTPNVDRLASNGILYTNAYATSPVCSASRSALITGVMQTRTGTHQHRSSRAEEGKVVPVKQRIELPNGIKAIPELLREAGYYTFNSGKDDYNFHYDRRALYTVGTSNNYEAGMNGWQGNRAEHWKSFTLGVWNERKDKNQPWFGQIQIDGGKGDSRYLQQSDRILQNSVDLPPYFPDTPALRQAWTIHYDNARGSDIRISQILSQLEADGEMDNTVIFFFSDHGHNTSLRHKQFCYEGGLHVPLIIKGNHTSLKSGHVVNDLVSLLDVTATTLGLARIKLPEYLDGQNLFGDEYTPLEFVISARDRCDYTIDRIRTVRSKRYRYIRNYYPHRPLMQPGYRDGRPASVDMHRLYKLNKLTKYQADHWFGIRPTEELYDMQADPHQMINLSMNNAYNKVLIEHRNILLDWIEKTNDRGRYSEDEAQLKATYELWKDREIFKNAKINPEYDKFR